MLPCLSPLWSHRHSSLCGLPLIPKVSIPKFRSSIYLYTEIYILFLHCLLNNPLVLTELYCKIHTVIYTWILVYIPRLVLTLLVWLVVWLVCWLFGCLVFWWLVNWFWLVFCFWFSWNTEDQSQGLARARQAPYPWATSPAQIATSFHCILCIFCFDMFDMFLSWWIR